MTLLSKASTITTPTAYSEGFLHSVKPADSFGEELVTNGDFSTSSDWTFTGGGIAISGGKLNFASTTREAQQSISVVSGKKYRVSFEISNYVAGDIRIELGSSLGTLRTSNGVYVEFIEASGAALLEIDAINPFTGSIDNVSVKEVLGADFTFTRASSATRVNEQGLIEKERENLLLQSNSFDTTWAKSNASLTSGQSGYDGTNNAYKLVSNTSNAGHRVFQAQVQTGVLTFSIYAKSAGYNFMFVYINGKSAYFDLSSGAVGTTSGLIDSDISSAGNGYYRCSITFSGITTTNVEVYIANTGSSYVFTGDGTSGIFIQDAQLEQGLVATDYIETTTSSVAVGITNDIPRINYENGIGNFLLEPQRTNLIGQSEYYGSYWNINDVTIISNDTISPEGIQNATRITESATLARHRLGAGTITIPTAGIYISSVFMKKGTARYGFVHFSGTASYTIVVDLEEGIITDTATNGTIAYQNIEDYGNGWYRCSVGGNRNTANTSYLAQFGIAGSAVPSSYNNYIPQYTGSTSNYLYAYGNQLETGYLTSYIPTYGSAVTRAAETCNNAGNSDLFNDSEGVLYAEIAALYEDGTNKAITLGDGTSNNRIQIFYHSSNELRSNVVSGGVGQITGFDYTGDIEVFNKVALKYKGNDCSFWVNGTEIATDLSATMPSGLDTLMFDNGTGASDFYGKTKMVSTFKEALSNSELECLTSWSSFERMATAQNYTIQ